MKKQMLMVALAFAVSAHVVTAQPQPAPGQAPAAGQAQPGPLQQLKATAAQTQAALWASRVLARYHYKPTPLDDAMSAKIFDNYFKSLDSEKLYFTQADIDQYTPARMKLDDSINNEDLTLPFQIYNTYQQRFSDRMAYARELASKGQFDFTGNETLPGQE
jgi:carboxyl-terminal processing protease